MQFRLSNNHCFWWNYYSISIVNRDKIWTKHKDLVQRGYSIKTMILNHYVFHSESWSSSILVIWCKRITRKSPWCWEMLRAEGEEGVRGYDDWMMSPMQWTWIWANSGKWWGTGRPGVLQSMGSPTGSDTTGWLTNSNNNGFHITHKPTHDTHTVKNSCSGKNKYTNFQKYKTHTRSVIHPRSYGNLIKDIIFYEGQYWQIFIFLQEMVKDGEAWYIAVHGVTKSRKELSNWTTAVTSWEAFFMLSDFSSSSLKTVYIIYWFSFFKLIFLH